MKAGSLSYTTTIGRLNIRIIWSMFLYTKKVWHTLLLKEVTRMNLRCLDRCFNAITLYSSVIISYIPGCFFFELKRRLLCEVTFRVVFTSILQS